MKIIKNVYAEPYSKTTGGGTKTAKSGKGSRQTSVKEKKGRTTTRAGKTTSTRGRS